MTKNLEYYLNLPWSYCFEWSDEDECYIASVQELKGCMSHGDSILEATEMIQDALKSYLTCALQYNEVIPEPLKPIDYKGNITYRTTKENHYKIAKRAKSLNISINSFIEQAVCDKLQHFAC